MAGIITWQGLISHTYYIASSHVAGDYVVEVHVMDYNNPTNGAAALGGRCCDHTSMPTCSGGYRCDNFFVYCLRPFNTSATERGCVDGLPMETSNHQGNDGSIDFNQSTVLGLPNPLPLTVSGPWQVE